MKKFCKVKIDEGKVNIKECINTNSRKEAEKKLKNIEGELFEMQNEQIVIIYERMQWLFAVFKNITKDKYETSNRQANKNGKLL